MENVLHELIVVSLQSNEQFDQTLFELADEVVV